MKKEVIIIIILALVALFFLNLTITGNLVKETSKLDFGYKPEIKTIEDVKKIIQDAQQGNPLQIALSPDPILSNNIILKYPYDSQIIEKSNDINFICEVNNIENIDSVTLYTDISGSWQSYESLNSDELLNGTNQEKIYLNVYEDINPGNYNYNCLVKNLTGANFTASFNSSFSYQQEQELPRIFEHARFFTWGTSWCYPGDSCYPEWDEFISDHFEIIAWRGTHNINYLNQQNPNGILLGNIQWSWVSNEEQTDNNFNLEDWRVQEGLTQQDIEDLRLHYYTDTNAVGGTYKGYRPECSPSCIPIATGNNWEESRVPPSFNQLILPSQSVRDHSNINTIEWLNKLSEYRMFDRDNPSLGNEREGVYLDLIVDNIFAYKPENTHSYWGTSLSWDHEIHKDMFKNVVLLREYLNSLLGKEPIILGNIARPHYDGNSFQYISDLNSKYLDWGFLENWITTDVFNNGQHMAYQAGAGGSSYLNSLDSYQKTKEGEKRLYNFKLHDPLDRTNRNYLFTYVTFLLFNNDNAYFGINGYHGEQPNYMDGQPGNDLPDWIWLEAYGYNLGNPIENSFSLADYKGDFNTDEHFLFSEGSDYYLFAREYENALVFSKIRKTTSDIMDGSTYDTFNLVNDYVILNPDGTFGNTVNSISLRNNEGIILVKTDSPPNVALLSPKNLQVINENKIEFSCSGRDETQVANLSLYHDINGWQNVYTLQGSSNQLSLEYNETNINPGIYNYNCLAYDIDGNSHFNIINHTFNVSYETDSSNPPSSGGGSSGSGSSGSSGGSSSGGGTSNTGTNNSETPFLENVEDLDINLELVSSEIIFENNLGVNIFINNSENKTLTLIYKIENLNGEILYEELEEIFLNENYNFVKNLDVSQFSDGNYRLLLEINDETQIINLEKEFIIRRAATLDYYLWILVCVFILSIFILTGIKIRKKRQGLRKLYKGQVPS